MKKDPRIENAAIEVSRKAVQGVGETGLDAEQLTKLAEKLTTQDPPIKSKRLWGAVASGLVVALTAIGYFNGEVSLADAMMIGMPALAGAIAPIASKQGDARPVKGDIRLG